MIKRYFWNILAGILLALVLWFGYRYFQPEKTVADKMHLETRTIQTPLGWGYEVLTDGKVYIRQEFIPAINGRRGFPTEALARATGKLVMEKLKNKQLPAITTADLQQLGVLKDTSLRK
jgi:hypothetical protein